MQRIILNGCNGKMGQVITTLSSDLYKEDCVIVAGCDLNASVNQEYPVFQKISDCDIKADVILDFTHPSAFSDLTAYAIETKTALIVATTGLSSVQKDSLADIAKIIPVFFSPNMSLGINLLIDLVKKAAKVLEGSFDIEIEERHHNLKIDAPSGTALNIADSINNVLSQKCEYMYDRHARRKKRSRDEIGIHSMRGGTIVGEHTVIFAGNDEIFEIKHSALSREIFATGAIKAALFMKDRPAGFYSMDDLLED